MTVWTPAELRANVRDALMLVTNSARKRAEQTLGYSIVAAPTNVPATAGHVVVVGGGTLIDEVKVWRWKHRPDVRLYAAASIWGSGAEVSPVAVLNAATKEIYVAEGLRPDVRVRWPSLGESVTGALARDACGDAMSHAFEALVSPIASDTVRRAAGAVLKLMLAQPLSYSPQWFDLSAEACELQAASSVGLVHGIAHVLENSARRAAQQSPAVSHARLCSTYLLPVLDYDLARSDKVRELLGEYGVSNVELRTRALQLHDVALYRAMLPRLVAEWKAVVTDRCTRTNPALVTMTSLGFFQQWNA